MIGAGVAGLAAAGDLAAAGLRVIVLEARERCGGRVLTRHDPRSPVPIELGAEFVHGRPAATLEIAERAALPLVEVAGEHWVGDGRELRLHDDLEGELGDVFAEMSAERSPDRSFADYVAACRGGEEWRGRRALALQYVRGFHAADPARVSERALARGARREQEIDGERSFRLLAGYDGIVAQLVARVPTIQLGVVVTSVCWQAGRAEVTARASDGERHYIGRRAVVALPLGVLKASVGGGVVRFEPALVEKRDALRKIEVGAAVRVVLRFHEKPWEDATLTPLAGGEDLHRLSFLHARIDDAPFPVFWTEYPVDAPSLTAWSGGPDAEALSGESAERLAERAIGVLARLLGVDRARLADCVVGAHAHDWQRDPYALGAYSYIAVGGIDAPADLARPLADTLFFAGEATDSAGDTGTVHGAIATGRRAAREVLAAARATADRR